MARTVRRDHLGHFVSPLGELVPMVAGVVILIFIGAFPGLPSVMVFLAVILPAGLVLALLLEVQRLDTSTPAREARRLALGLGPAGLVFGVRGGS